MQKLKPRTIEVHVAYSFDMRKQITTYFILFCLASVNSCDDTQKLNNDLTEEETLFPNMDSTAGELNFVPNENAYHGTYKEKGIKQCYTILSEFENGKLIDKYISHVDYYDTLGYLMHSEEYFVNESQPTCTVKYEYDSLRRMIKELWHWKNPDSFDKSIYKYENRLTEILDYSKDSLNSDYQLESTTKVFYKNGKIDLLLTENDDTISYFTHKEDHTFQYSKSNVLGAEFQNGLQIKSIYDTSVWSLERAEKGNVLKMINRDSSENIESTITDEYDSELLIKSTTFSEDGEILFIYDYKYVY